MIKSCLVNSGVESDMTSEFGLRHEKLYVLNARGSKSPLKPPAVLMVFGYIIWGYVIAAVARLSCLLFIPGNTN